MPTNQALQVFYGTIPLILVIAGYFTREQMVLKDILARLRRIEEWLPKVDAGSPRSKPAQRDLPRIAGEFPALTISPPALTWD